MFAEFLVFWLVVLCVCELIATRQAAYSVSLLIGLVLTVVVILFLHDYDLFASVLLVLYSSVFLLLAMFLLYFSRYWGKTSAGWYVEPALVDCGVVLAILCAPSLYVSAEGGTWASTTFSTQSAFWSSRLVGYDYYSTLQSVEFMTVSLIHNLLYKFYVVEALFLNIYLLLGLVLSVGFLVLFKSWVSPTLAARIFSLSRFKFWFFFASNVRVRTLNKFRRQTRRKNNSHLKYKNSK